MNELENNKIKLYGFNNLTKTLSFNIYDICYAETEREQKDYIAYIDEQYNSERLTKILIRVAEMIGAQVLNISKQDYEPQGASVNVLIAEERISPENIDKSCNRGKPFFEEIGMDENSIKKGGASQDTDTVHAHLDKSHITVHTFPEYHPDNSISTFRVDIDIATCGEISPLNTLNYLIDSFDSDILKIYDAIDVNVYQSNIFHTKMLIKEIRLQNYLFNQDVYEIAPKKRLEITDRLRKEMIEIYSGMNIY